MEMLVTSVNCYQRVCRYLVWSVEALFIFRNSMLAKVHRIDIDKVDITRMTEYAIPPDNPFADGVQGLPEIYAYGVRNIWRCGKDRGDPVTSKYI